MIPVDTSKSSIASIDEQYKQPKNFEFWETAARWSNSYREIVGDIANENGDVDQGSYKAPWRAIRNSYVFTLAHS